MQFRNHDIRHYKVRPKIEALGAASVVLLAIFTVNHFLYFNGEEAQKGEFDDGLQRYAESIATLIDGDEHKEFRAGQENTDTYEEAIWPLRKALLSSCHIRSDSDVDRAGESPVSRVIVEDLRKAQYARRENDEVHTIFQEIAKGSLDCSIIFIYTAIMHEGRVKYVLDPWPLAVPNYACERESSTSNPGSSTDCGEMKSYIMDEYPEANDDFRRTLKDQQTRVTKYIYKDIWGEFFSAYAPFYDSRGEFVGIVGVDVRADAYKRRFAPIRRAAYRAYVTGFFIAFLVITFVWFLRRFIYVLSRSRLDIHTDYRRAVGLLGDQDSRAPGARLGRDDEG